MEKSRRWRCLQALLPLCMAGAGLRTASTLGLLTSSVAGHCTLLGRVSLCALRPGLAGSPIHTTSSFVADVGRISYAATPIEQYFKTDYEETNLDARKIAIDPDTGTPAHLVRQRVFMNLTRMRYRHQPPESHGAALAVAVAPAPAPGAESAATDTSGPVSYESDSEEDDEDEDNWELRARQAADQMVASHQAREVNRIAANPDLLPEIQNEHFVPVYDSHGAAVLPRKRRKSQRNGGGNGGFDRDGDSSDSDDSSDDGNGSDSSDDSSGGGGGHRRLSQRRSSRARRRSRIYSDGDDDSDDDDSDQYDENGLRRRKKSAAVWRLLLVTRRLWRLFC